MSNILNVRDTDSCLSLFFPVAKEKILRLFTLLSSFGIQSWADDDINNFSQHVSWKMQKCKSYAESFYPGWITKKWGHRNKWQDSEFSWGRTSLVLGLESLSGSNMCTLALNGDHNSDSESVKWRPAFMLKGFLKDVCQARVRGQRGRFRGENSSVLWLAEDGVHSTLWPVFYFF